MTAALWMYAIIVLMVGAYGVVFCRTDGWRKWIAVPTYLLLCFACLFCSYLSLGRPVPGDLLMTNLETVPVVKVLMVENEAIYIWAWDETTKQPISISRPWNKEDASEIAGVLEKAKDQGGMAMINLEDGTVFSDQPREIPKKDRDG